MRQVDKHTLRDLAIEMFKAAANEADPFVEPGDREPMRTTSQIREEWLKKLSEPLYVEHEGKMSGKLPSFLFASWIFQVNLLTGYPLNNLPG